jgi:5-methylcytosine-specific restriction endonuclease McrA
MDFTLETFHNISNSDLIEDIKNVAKKLNKDTITISEYKDNGKCNTRTVERRFGSWLKALQICELKPNRLQRVNIKMTDTELFKNLEEVWISLGRQPRRREMKEPLSKCSERRYTIRFGSWQNALKRFVAYINDESNDECDNINDVGTNDKINLPLIKHKTKREISDRLRFRILMRDGFTCKSCGASPTKELGVELHVDHIIPWSKGGETIENNLETKCSKCNLGKGNAFDK